MKNTSKSFALEFLQTLQVALNRNLSPVVEMRTEVAKLVETSRIDRRYRHLCSPEHAFTRGIALPKIHEELTSTFGLTTKEAREALLAEGWRNIESISSNTPARIIRHPFDKALTSDSYRIYEKWRGETSRPPLTQSCPDFALRPPAPHKIVFEVKYFTQGSSRQAAKELVSNLYQAFFYRALPPSDDPPPRTWDYDYACLLAFDASHDGALTKAWESLAAEVRDGFWHGANVYVMLLRGSDSLQRTAANCGSRRQ